MVSGSHVKQGVSATISPSMDIEVSSNFERALWQAYGRDGAAISQLMDELNMKGGFPVSQGALQALRETYGSGCCSEDETRQTIRWARGAIGRRRDATGRRTPSGRSGPPSRPPCGRPTVSGRRRRTSSG